MFSHACQPRARPGAKTVVIHVLLASPKINFASLGGPVNTYENLVQTIHFRAHLALDYPKHCQNMHFATSEGGCGEIVVKSNENTYNPMVF